MEDHWCCTIEFLDTVANNGIVLNPEKLQFCSREVDFVGFCIHSNKVELLPK